MANAKIKRKKTTDMWKKKEWYAIKSPREFEEKTVASTPTDNPKKLVNRIVTIPLSDITGNLRHQPLKLSFKIRDVRGKTATTKFHMFELAREFLRRNVARNRSMITAIENLRTKDNIRVQVSAYAFTYSKIDTSKKNDIRKLMITKLNELASENNLNAFIEKSLQGGIASELFKEAKTVARLRRLEIGKLELVPEKAKKEEEFTVHAEEENPPETSDEAQETQEEQDVTAEAQ
ncbi:MAG: 30S ribosomal protein S3ae [DPANN group archaeon]|nr:30S ribosomal protein S3ae [DPANN group archaeon]